MNVHKVYGKIRIIPVTIELYGKEVTQSYGWWSELANGMPLCYPRIVIENNLRRALNNNREKVIHA